MRSIGKDMKLHSKMWELCVSQAFKCNAIFGFCDTQVNKVLRCKFCDISVNELVNY